MGNVGRAVTVSVPSRATRSCQGLPPPPPPPHHTRMGTSYRQQISHYPTTNQRQLKFQGVSWTYIHEYICDIENIDIKERH